MKEDIYYGGSEHRPPCFTFLKAGPLICRYEVGYLRYIKAGNTELLRMIYPAVRDHNWATITPQISNEQIVQEEDHFDIHYDCVYQEGEIDFRAHYHLQGDREGNIQFEMQGEAMRTFLKNRIGFNVLHPPQVAGLSCRVQHMKGEDEKGVFPRYISPHQPFMNMKGIVWKMEGIQTSLKFEGDIFEMEDQRNWTDASFKTYSTPLGLPFPVRVQKGDKIHQSVRLSVENAKTQKHVAAKHLVISLGKERYPLPDIGIGQSSDIAIITEEDLKLLKAIRFSHYRVDLKLSEEKPAQAWKRAVQEAHQLNLPLELALHFNDDHLEDELERFGSWIEKDRPAIKQLMIFSTVQKSTSTKVLQKVLPALRKLLPKALIGAGTDCFFTELNRERLPTNGLDFLSYSLNPQVHQFDNQSLVETLQAQAFTLDSAKQFSEGLPVHISPVTLKMRFNPNATGPEAETHPDQLPSQVDTRQMSLFGAGWTLGSLKYLTNSDLNAITYFETLGRRGLMQGANEPILPQKFRVKKGIVYPMYWVFYWLLQDKKVEVIRTRSSDPLQVEGLAWTAKGRQMMMLANMQPETEEIEVSGWKNQFEIKVLDQGNFHQFTEDVEAFLALPWNKTKKSISLSPYAIAILK
ncbi:hypothetical protein [Catalinimonas niigatensis]|uniref:hypothetical protein n=1 Tax=Catalinimonas niigatensis TaxID=1397264 RepID=UPI0026668128|nr:hypothetical protein [Catalinimonas niigatensis]WPP50950.1 hypothetical protein PZB72_00900 [Catalinimonas niigatensis]